MTIKKKVSIKKAPKKAKPATVDILKKDILKALAKEPLAYGSWVQKPDLEKIGDCPVCAVGAVLRGKRLTNREVQNTASVLSDTGRVGGVGDRFHAAHEAIELVKEGKYLNALSVFFESRRYDSQRSRDWIHRKTTEKERRELIDFVESVFPDDLCITLDVKGRMP